VRGCSPLRVAIELRAQINGDAWLCRAFLTGIYELLRHTKCLKNHTKHGAKGQQKDLRGWVLANILLDTDANCSETGVEQDL